MIYSFLFSEKFRVIVGIFGILGAVAGVIMTSMKIYERFLNGSNALKPITANQRQAYIQLKSWHETLSEPSPIDRGHAKSTLLVFRSGEPELKSIGRCYADDQVIERSVEISKLLQNDEEMGFLASKPSDLNWEASPLLLNYCSNRYSVYRAAQQLGVPLLPITSGALICCTDKNCVIYGERHKKTDTFASSYHHFGGGFKAERGMEPGDGRIIRTAERELEEEIGLKIHKSRLYYASALIEGGTNYFQYYFLGVDITGEERDRARPGGDVVTLEDFPIEELADKIIAKHFVPTCVLQTIIWLSVGAPASSGRSFDQAAIERQLNKLKEYYSFGL